MKNNSTLKKVQYADAVAASKEYFGGDELAATVWVSKYALKDSLGNIYESSPEQMHHRIASELARIERNYGEPLSEQEIFDLLDHFRYVIPQGGPMTGIGNNLQVASLSNCFVIGHKNPADSYGGIFRMDEEQVQLMKDGCARGRDLRHHDASSTAPAPHRYGRYRHTSQRGSCDRLQSSSRAKQPASCDRYLSSGHPAE